MTLLNQKNLFNIPSEITFLNCSYVAPAMNRVREAGVQALDKCSRPWELTAHDWFDPGEKLRSLFARIIGADSDNIALIPSVSYGMAVAAKNISLRPSQKIIVLEQQYPSNYYAWRELSKESGAEMITIARPPDDNWTAAVLEKIDAQTGLVTLPNCHWTDGTLLDLETIAKAARKVGACLVVDASQSAGAYPIDIVRIQPDFLVTVAYKWLLGPYGLAYLYADQKYHRDGKPIEQSWLIRKGAENFAGLVDYQDDLKAGARRFDSGEYSSFVKIPMAIAALEQVLEWGPENIQSTLSVLTDKISARARGAGLQTSDRKRRAGHMLGVRFPKDKIELLARRLSEDQVYISWRGASMRISPHLYNDEADVDRLCGLLERFGTGK